jgi:hypothetical protein
MLTTQDARAAAVAVADYLIGAFPSVSVSCLRAPARMFRSE